MSGIWISVRTITRNSGDTSLTVTSDRFEMSPKSWRMPSLMIATGATMISESVKNTAR